MSLLKQTILEMAHSNGSDRDCGVKTSLKCNSVGEMRDRTDNKPNTEIPIVSYCYRYALIVVDTRV